MNNRFIRSLFTCLFLVFIHFSYTQNCGITVDAGPDINICSPGGDVQLNAQVFGGNPEFIRWEADGVLQGESTLNPVFNVSQTTEFVIYTFSQSGNNLVPNGDFEEGNQLFNSIYNFSPGDLFEEGTYDVDVDPAAVNALFSECVDVTFGDGTGNMLMVNGSVVVPGMFPPAPVPYFNTINIQPNTYYYVSLYLTSLFDVDPAVLEISLDGEVLLPVVDLGAQPGPLTPPPAPCEWQRIERVWFSGNNGMFGILRVNPLSTQAYGNDWALDEVTMREVCVETDTITVFVDPPPIGETEFVICEGECVIVGGTQYCAPTVFDEFVIDPLGCDSIVRTRITRLEPRAEIAPFDPLSCYSGGTGVLDASGSSSDPGTVVSWTGPDGFASGSRTPLISEPGEYILTVSITENGKTCSATESVMVTKNDSIPVAVANPIRDTIDCITTQLTLSGAGSQQGPFMEYEWRDDGGSNIGEDTTVVVDEGGTYVFRVRDRANGCVGIAEVEIIEITDPPVVTPMATVINCAEDALLSFNSNEAISTVRWEDPNGTLISSNPTANASQAGEYTLRFTGVSGCSDSVTIDVGIDTTSPQFMIQDDTIDCGQANVQLFSPGDSSLASPIWTGPNGFMSMDRDPLVTDGGEYILSLSDTSNGCRGTDTLTLVVNSGVGINFSLSDTTISCDPDSLTLTAPVSATLINPQWTGPNGFNSSSVTPVIRDPGIYNLTLTSAIDGCTGTETLEVVADTVRTVFVIANATLTCASDSVQLLAPANPALINPQWTGPNGFTSTDRNPQVTGIGMYTLQLQSSSNNCPSSAMLEVIADTIRPMVSAEGDSIDCSSPTATLVASSNDPAATFDWTGPTGAMFMGDMINVSQIGVYTVRATAANGCSSSTTAELSASDDIPQISVFGDTITCSKDTAVIRATSTTPGVTVSWTGPMGYTSSAFVNTVSVSGNYEATVRAPNGCENSAIAVVVLDTAAPTISVSDSTLTCDVTLITPRFQVSADAISLDWQGPGGFMFNGNNPTLALVGNYTVTATADNGCSRTTDFDIGIDTVRPTASLSADTLNCALTQLPIQSSYTGRNIGIDWSGPGGFISSDSTPIVNVAGTYTVIIRDAVNGCQATEQITIEENVELPIVEAESDTITCNNPQAGIRSTSSLDGSTFSWSGPGGFVSMNASDVVSQPGLYTVVVTAPNGCRDSATTVVEIDTISPSLVLEADTLTCDITMVDIGATSADAVSYAWSGAGAPFPDAAIISVSEAGVYSVIATAENGCTSQASIDVEIDTVSPTVIADGGTLSCDSVSIRLSGQLSVGSSIVWSGPGGFSSNIINPSANTPGIYTLTATAENGCTASDTALVVADVNQPQATVNADTIFCDRPMAAIRGQIITAGASGVWSGPGGYASIQDTNMVSLPGEYIFTVTAANGCDANFSAFVRIDTVAPSVTLQLDTLNCETPTQTVDATVIAQDLQQSSWSGPGGFMSSLLEPTISTPGSYTLQITDVNGCTAVAMLEAQEDRTTTFVSFTSDTISCDRLQAQIIAAASEPSEFSWTGPGGFTSAISDPVVNLPGIYTLIVTTDETGCIDTFTTGVEADTASPVIATTNDTLTCTITEVQIGVTSPDDPDIQYEWAGPAAFQSNVASPSVDLGGTYTVTATALNGCESQAQSLVSYDTIPPALTVNNVLIDCNNPQAVLRANVAPGVTVRWFDSGVQVATADSFVTDKVGTYTAVATSENGCTSQVESVVTGDFGEPDASAQGVELDCINTSLEISASSITAGVTYEWSGPFGFTAIGATALVQETGAYVVTVTASNGCASTATAVVTADVDTPLTVAAVIGELNCVVNAVQLDASQSQSGTDITYEWYDEDGLFLGQGITLEVEEAGTYRLQARSADNGCFGTDFIDVIPNDEKPTDVAVTVADPVCQGNLGSITIDSIIGGSAPYVFRIGEDAFSTKDFYDDLEPGVYTIDVEDELGCELSLDITIEEPELLTVTLPAEVILNFSDSMQLKPEINFSRLRITDISWTPTNGGLSCIDCLEPFIGPTPITRPYQIELTIDSTCILSAEILVRIKDERFVYFPNVFSPHKKDGFNDRFFITARESDIEEVKSFEIYDRWGQRIYGAYGFQPNDPFYGWDGTFNGEKMTPAVFVYRTEILFVDGISIIYRGTVTLVD